MCGIIADLTVLWFHESATQVIAHLVQLLNACPQVDRLGYDDMCHLCMRAENLQRLYPSDDLARLLACDLFIDKHHFPNHVGRLCRQRHNPADRPYLETANTPVCEQAWRYLNTLKHSVRYMSSEDVGLIMLRMVYLRNRRIQA